MSNIQISIYGTTNRAFLWKWLYETVSMNKVNFEIVLAGNAKPDFELPNNFKFIYTNVKPVQCTQIAAFHCTGEMLQNLGDDCENQPFALDILYDRYKKQNDYKCIMTPHFYSPSPNFGGDDITDWACRLVGADTSSLPLHIGGLISHRFFKELGGHDKRFVFGDSDPDVQIRAQMAGGKIEFQKDVWMAERKDLCPGWQTGNYYTYAPADRALLYSLWFENKIFTGKRKDDVQKFIQNETLLTTSQGPNGKWD